MKRSFNASIATLGLLLIAAGCPGPATGVAGADAAVPDSGSVDSGSPDGGDAGSAVGQECAQVSECPNLQNLPECRLVSADGGSWPSGYCTKVCYPSPATAADGCPSDAVCVPRGTLGEPSDSSGRCLRSCSATSPCRTGYRCQSLGPLGEDVCAP